MYMLLTFVHKVSTLQYPGNKHSPVREYRAAPEALPMPALLLLSNRGVMTCKRV
jgi:hypothetical protein